MASNGSRGLNQRIGRRGEDLAAGWYLERGYDLIDRNWRCPAGEVDLIAGGSGVIVFCEVKTRSSARFGSPLEAISVAKAARMRRVAMAWLDAHPRRWSEVRLDVAAVVGTSVEVVQAAV